MLRVEQLRHKKQQKRLAGKGVCASHFRPRPLEILMILLHTFGDWGRKRPNVEEIVGTADSLSEKRCREWTAQSE